MGHEMRRMLNVYSLCQRPLPYPHPASALAFDQYGQLSDQLEQELALRDRAETLATEVSHVTTEGFIQDFLLGGGSTLRINKTPTPPPQEICFGYSGFWYM